MFDNSDLLRMVLKWKRHLLVLGGAAVLLSALFSSPYFIKPKYRSFAVIYPSNLIPYGAETPTEQMLQLFQSNIIENKLIRRFHLAAHYEIDTTPGNRYWLEAEYRENINVSKTEYEAVRIEVLDTDPITADSIANAMIDEFNIETRELQKKKSEEVVLIHKNELERKQHEIDSLGDSLKFLKVKYGLLDYKSQAKEASREYYKSLGGNAQKTADIIASIRALEEKGSEFQALSKHLDGTLSAYENIKVQYDNALRDVEKKLTYTNVVIKPEVSDKKAYPVRWIIVTFSTLSTLLLSLIVIGIIENRRKK